MSGTRPYASAWNTSVTMAPAQSMTKGTMMSDLSPLDWFGIAVFMIVLVCAYLYL
jgi:hypothetical protein